MPKEFNHEEAGFHPFGELIGLNFTGCADGRSTCELEVNERLLNPHGVIHGGVMYSMADTGMGGALYTRLEPDELCSTVEVKITYFRPVSSGTLRCETKVVNRTRSLAYMESEITAGREPVARATGTFFIFPAAR
jgi:acyl-CoA thioesterase